MGYSELKLHNNAAFIKNVFQSWDSSIFPKTKTFGDSGLIRFNKFGILIEFLFLYQFFVQY